MDSPRILQHPTSLFSSLPLKINFLFHPPNISSLNFLSHNSASGQEMNSVIDELDPSEFVEVDPTGRYGRYNEVLGKGASKTVYRAFDEYEGIEVAWNQVKLYDFLQSPEDLERLYCEIHLLKTLKHSNIMKFYTSWVDTANRNINFVTEMFTSGTLRQYRQRHKKVNIRAVKHWCSQILKGLVYLHSHHPPVIHRDLKCDNIFVNGNQGEVKIGDLGLAAILRESHAARCVGTPEFMAPEVYAEEYNELVDIYSFGMCILEMVTFEYPYSECTQPAQIYKKVISGKKPDALNKVKDPEVRVFIDKCLVTVSLRLPARELLMDPFLQDDESGFDLRPIDYWRDFDGIGPMLRQPLLDIHHQSNNGSLVNGYSSYLTCRPDYDLDSHQANFETNEIDLFTSQEDEHLGHIDITIKGRRDDDGIFLRLRISDKEGRVRNIYFPFDIEADTAMSVAAEMVSELDITDQDVTKIADMIDGEIACLVPEWKSRAGLEGTLHHGKNVYCQNCASHGSLLNYLTFDNTTTKNLQILPCSKLGCASIHGRFEEITYQGDESEQCVNEGAPVVSNQSDGTHYSDIWAQHYLPDIDSSEYQSCGDDEPLEKPSLPKEDEKIIKVDKQRKSDAGETVLRVRDLADDYENEIRQELRWLKAKYQMQLRELRDHQLGIMSKPSSLCLNSNNREHGEEQEDILVKSFASGKNYSLCSVTDEDRECSDQRVQNFEAFYEACGSEHMVTAKNFYNADFLPQSLHRATSLPVDAIDF